MMNSGMKIMLRHKYIRNFSQSSIFSSVEAISKPISDNEIPPVTPKISKIVEEIAKLTLIEVSELNTVLKRTLNLPDAPVMSFGAMPQPGTQAAEEDEAPKLVKSSYTVKLTGFDETKKVALIKEVKGLLEGLNLVQAKKFVESLPTVIKSDIGKTEAEELKAKLESVGAVCTID